MYAALDVGESTNTEARGERGRSARDARLRCVMIVNPYSSGLTSRRERAIVEALRTRVELDVVRTERSGHAPQLASDVVAGGQHDVIISCGGDGTANEVMNGMSLDVGTAHHRPRVAVIPAGGTNVVARSLGFANHPIKSLESIISSITEGHVRRVSVGRADERTFLFAAGVGLDAEVIRRMEQRRSGRRPSDAAHLGAILSIYATSRFSLRDCMTITIADSDEQLRSSLLFVGNTTPMTYMGRRPVHFLPDARYELGLDLMGPQRASTFFSMRNSVQALGVGLKGRRLVSPEQLQLRHDVREFTVVCDEAEPLQVDGEYLGARTHIRFRALTDAVELVAPAP